MTVLEKIYSFYKKEYKVSIDTRFIEADCVFFALKGANFNGNKFAQQALEKGASMAIVDEIDYVTSDKTILVDDVLKTLQDLARHHRKELGLPIISLTGSNGKTTTKELIVRVLSEKFKTQATKGNLNNHIGVPLTLLSILPEHEIAVVEMGANHQKEIEMLCEIALPDFGYITNFGKAHLEGFGGIEGVIKGKSELYNYLQKENKIAFVNLDDPIQVEKSKGIALYTFGGLKGDILFADNPIKTSFVSVSYNEITISSHLIGSYNLDNIKSAIAIGVYFNIPKEKIKKAIEAYIPNDNRSQLIEKKGHKIILDAYNANPSSMKVALDNFSKLEGEKTVILGDMFELGTYSDKEHQLVVDQALNEGIDQIIVVGHAFFNTEKEVMRFNSMGDLKDFLKEKEVHKNVLIKGSRGMKLETILDFL